MKRDGKILTALAALLLLAGSAGAQLQLPAVFTDGLVLQQQSQAELWGWGSPGNKISVVAGWSQSDTLTAMVDDGGRWRMQLPTGSAGGPYTLSFWCAGEQIGLRDVMLGEVWLCSGQSNMEWSVNSGIDRGEEEAAAAHCPSLRIFHLPRQAADTPQNDCRTRWEHCEPASMRRTSATAYFFGRHLTEQLGVPVGIIVSAWGGTPAEVWTPAEVVKSDAEISATPPQPSRWWPSAPGVLYNQMISPVEPYSIAGCIWYQGEANTHAPQCYDRLMAKMVQSWRSRFGREFPFLYVQIAPFTYNSPNGAPAQVREKQQAMLGMVENCGMINISDLVTNVRDIHPRNKRAIGERLAHMALHRVYGQATQPYESPALGSVEVRRGTATLSFRGDFERLQSTVAGKVEGLRLVDAEGNEIALRTQLKGRTLLVTPKKKPQSPCRLLYCYDDATVGSLRTEAGLPVLPFRSDEVEF